jgi:predicted flavoprotein YhiN
LNRGLTSGRGDDNAETIKHRLKTFHEQSLPVIDRYSAEGKVASIDGTGTVAQVSAQKDDTFRTQFVVLAGGPSSNVTKFGTDLAERFGHVFLSVSSLVDAEIQLGTPRGRALEQLVKVTFSWMC